MWWGSIPHPQASQDHHPEPEKRMTRRGHHHDDHRGEHPLFTMSAAEVIEFMFPGRGFGTKVPPDRDSVADMNGPLGTVRIVYLMGATHPGEGRMRAVARCPLCGKWTAASRLRQHAHSAVCVELAKDVENLFKGV